MYGLIIEGVRFMILENFGQPVLTQVLQMTHLSEKAISTHDQYSEQIVPNMMRALCEITGMSTDQVGVLAGRFFVQFLVRHGYGDLMHVMGRRFSDFLKGLDNIHEYFRFSYPKIRPPSFYCSSESEDGLVLHYRSRRQGYIAYVIGQLVELARVFYKQDLGVKVLKKKEKGKFLFVIIQLTFNNSGLGLDNRLKEKVKNLNEYLPVDTISFLKMFPFYIAFNKKLDIIMCGQGLINLMPDIPGQNMTEVFDLQKPCIKFTAEGCLAHENCNFQIESLHPVVKRNQEEITVKINGVTEDKVELEKLDAQEEDYENLPYVILRGPIIYLKSCETFLLLATCVVEGLDAMFKMGLFLNDYGDADCNREIIMASIQKSDHLKNLLISEKQRSQVLTEMTREIAQNKRKARQLLAQMMPIEVASSLLRTGQSDHCEAFECCTIAFIKVVDFSRQSHHLTAAEIVNLLNTLYSLCDEIVDVHGVYKVETIGESYMISAGVPYPDDHDTEVVADCCLNMIARIKDTELYFGEKKHKVQVKIGAFTGPCVGGIVGLRAPRYCLFGDTVNCASRMESHNKVPMSIQIGQRTKDRLEKQAPAKFKIKHRGMIAVKGKGDMKAYELVGKSGRPRCAKHPPVKRTDDEDDEAGAGDILDDDNHRNSAMSRMSITWGDSLDHSRSGSADSRRNSNSSTQELNSTIAETIQQTASSVLFEGQYEVGFPGPPSAPKTEKKEQEKRENRAKQEAIEVTKAEEERRKDVKETLARQDFRLGLSSQESEQTSAPTESQGFVLKQTPAPAPIPVKPIVPSSAPENHTSTTAAPEIDTSRASLASVAIGDINSQTPRPTLDEFVAVNLEARSISKTVNLGITQVAQMSDVHSVASVDNVNTFEMEPADKVPAAVDLPQSASPTVSLQDSSRTATPTPVVQETKKGRLPSVDRHRRSEKSEMDSAKKIVDSQKEKSPKLQYKKPLPSIRRPERNGADSSKPCKCDEIRADPKLKTKVCSIQ